jgi:hypothetical protein
MQGSVNDIECFAREDYGKKIGLSMYQNVNKTLGVGVSVDQSANKLNLSLGGAFVPDKDTSLRGKVSERQRGSDTLHLYSRALRWEQYDCTTFIVYEASVWKDKATDRYDVRAQVDSDGIISALYTQKLCPPVRAPPLQRRASGDLVCEVEICPSLVRCMIPCIAAS